MDIYIHDVQSYAAGGVVGFVMRGAVRLFFSLLGTALLAGCISLVAPYDDTFDTSLNKLSEDTAKFLAAASAGGPERRFAAKETVAYYAASENVADRLLQRASLSRARVPCTGGKAVDILPLSRTGKLARPDDYKSFDCREEDLYAVRSYIDALEFVHSRDHVLTEGDNLNAGNQLQSAIMLAISDLLQDKPAAK